MTAFWLAALIATFGVAMMTLGLYLGAAPERKRKAERAHRDFGTPWKIAMESDQHIVVVWYQEKAGAKCYTLGTRTGRYLAGLSEGGE